jgi:Leucine-rich repeat (LRR) protein
MSNTIIWLPNLPNKMAKLWMDHNQIQTLPDLPDSLTNLGMNYNPITHIASLPPKLEYIWCGANRLTSFPAVPSSLEKLSCFSNQLTLLPELPKHMKELKCEGNPWNQRVYQYMEKANNPHKGINMYHEDRRAIRKRAKTLYSLQRLSDHLPVSEDVLHSIGEYVSGEFGIVAKQLECLKQWEGGT